MGMRILNRGISAGLLVGSLILLGTISSCSTLKDIKAGSECFKEERPDRCLWWGERYAEQGRYEDALDYFVVGCVKGSAKSCLKAGSLIKDEKKANKYFAMACKGGALEACSRIREVVSPSISVAGGSPAGETVPKSEKACVQPDPDNYFIGVVVYQYYEISNLSYVKNDKSLIKELAECYMGVPEENVEILENPSYAYLRKTLRKIAERIKRKDSTLYFYYTGHGVMDSEGKFYLLPSDASIEDEQALRESGIDVAYLKNVLSKAKGKKVAFIDACRVEPPWKPAVVMFKPKIKDISIVFSTKEGQISNVDRENKYSAFTRALYEMAQAGLVNMDVDDDGYVEIKELLKPLTKWIRKVSSDPKQTPDILGPSEIPVFPVD